MKNIQIIIKTKYLIFLIPILFSCKNQVNSLINFDPRSIDANEISLSAIADDIIYIPLDNSIPIGLIYNYRIVKNSVFLSIKDIGILEYTVEGKFVRKIGNIGRGPGEYTFCFDFTLDENGKTIFLLDQSIIKVYSSKGTFLRSFSLKDYGDNIASFDLIDSKMFVHFMLQYGNGKYDWILLDSLGNLISERKRTIPYFETNWGVQGGTYKFDHMIHYWNPFTDTVFSISKDLSYKPSFIISPGEHRFPRVKFNSFDQFQQYLVIEQVFETNRYLVLRYQYEKPTFAFIEKNTLKSFRFIMEVKKMGGTRPDLIGGITNDIDGGNEFQPGGASYRQKSYFNENDWEYIIGIIDPLKIKNRVASSEFKYSVPKYPEKKKELEKLANKLKETDNPVLVLVRLKK